MGRSSDWPYPMHPVGQALADEMPSDYALCELCGCLVFRFSMEVHMQFFHWEPEPDPGFWRTLFARIARAMRWSRNELRTAADHRPGRN